MHLASVIDLFTHNTHAHTHSQRHTRDNKSTDWPNWPTERTNRRQTHEGRVSKGHATDQRRLRPRPGVRVRVRFRSLLPLLCSLPRATVADTNHLRPSLRSLDAICNDIFIYTLVFFPSLSPLCLAVVCSLRSIMLFPVSCGQQTRERRKKLKNTEVSWSSG